MDNENKIENEFRELIGKLTDNQFWEYIRSWKDEQDLLDTMNNWDIKTKKEAIKEMKSIIFNDRCFLCDSKEEVKKYLICDDCAVEHTLKDKY